MRLKQIGAVSALALFAGVATAALAQAPEGQAQPPRPQQEGKQAPDRGAQSTAPAQQKKSEEADTGQRRGEARKNDEEPSAKSSRAEGKTDQSERRGSRAEQSGKQAEPKRKEAEQQRERRDRQAEPAKKAEPAAKQRQAGQNGEQNSGVQLSEQQETKVRERFREARSIDRARVSNVNFNISIGTHVPNHVHLVTLPTTVVEVVPEYRGYLYFAVADEIVIVHPRTHVIVTTIRLDHASTRSAGKTNVERLTLTSAQRQLILRTVEMRSDVRLGIGDVSIGMSVPRNVTLRQFPRTIIDDIPELRSYRYFVFEKDVAVVDPKDQEVVLVIGD